MVNDNGARLTINGVYAKLPEGEFSVAEAWSGDIVGAEYYLPKGTPEDVLGYWYPDDKKGLVGNDTIAIPADAPSPRLAHEFLNFFLDKHWGYVNFADWNGYQPPMTSIVPDRLVQEGSSPRRSRPRSWTRRTSRSAISRASSRPRPMRFGSTPGARSRQVASDTETAPARAAGSATTRSRRRQGVRVPALVLAVVHPPGSPVAAAVLRPPVLRGPLGGIRNRRPAVPEPAARLPAVVVELRHLRHDRGEVLRRGPDLLRPADPNAALRRSREPDLPRARVRGRLLHRTARRTLEGSDPGAVDLAVLDQLPDADLRVAEPAAARRVHQRRGRPVRPVADHLDRPTDHGDPRARVRLHPVHDPAAVRVLGPHRPAACSRPAATWGPRRSRPSGA